MAAPPITTASNIRGWFSVTTSISPDPQDRFQLPRAALGVVPEPWDTKVHQRFVATQLGMCAGVTPGLPWARGRDPGLFPGVNSRGWSSEEPGPMERGWS